MKLKTWIIQSRPYLVFMLLLGRPIMYKMVMTGGELTCMRGSCIVDSHLYSTGVRFMD